MRQARWGLSRLGILLLLFLAPQHGQALTPEESAFSTIPVHPDHWQLSREASTVAVGEVVAATSHILLRVTRVIQGEGCPDLVSFHEPLPLVPPPNLVFLSKVRTAAINVGDEWLVFLSGTGGRKYSVLHAVGEDVGEVERAVLDRLKADSITDPETRCRFLVNLALTHPESRACALKDLEAYRAARHLEILHPLKDSPETLWGYIQLIQSNPRPETTAALLEILASSDGPYLREVIMALGTRDPSDDELSRKILKKIEYDDPDVRACVIHTLKERRYWSASTAVRQRLRDPDHVVRASAVDWPWEESGLDTRSVLRDLRPLARDENDLVRTMSCRALVRLGDISSVPILCLTDLGDPCDIVRRMVDMDALWRTHPFGFGAVVLLPGVIGVALVWCGMLILRRRGFRPLHLVAGLGTGYTIGMVGGCLLGMLRTLDPVTYTVFITPAVTTPIGALVAPFVPGMAAKAWASFRRAGNSAGGIDPRL